MVPKFHRLAAPGLAIALLAACDSATGASLPDGPPVVQVDFAQGGVTARSMVGFLHAMIPGSPPDSMVVPLRPALWRTPDPAYGARAMGFGARWVLLMSDLWGYPATGWTPPYQDWAAWEARVREIAQATRGQPIVYDIWNEPDQVDFWRGTEAQFYETFRRAERVLREELGPGAVVSGPGYAHFGESKIRDFLRNIRQRGGRVDVLSWHEFLADGELPAIQSHLQTARREFLNNSAYRAMGLSEIQVQEVGSVDAQYQPSTVLASFYFLEAGGADAAARACWLPCWDNTLSNLLTPAGEPRAVWWAHQAYASTLDARITSETNDPRLVTFASRGSDGVPARVVVSHFGLRANSPPLDVTLELANLRMLAPSGGTGQFRVRVSQIPSTGPQPLLALPVLADTVVTAVADSVVRVPLPAFAVDEGRVITIAPEPAAP
ncbi:MAG TPA: hypothetical protein VF746_03595 [Longimicrobium sp.]|jgi:hypothetical protein